MGSWSKPISIKRYLGDLEFGNPSFYVGGYIGNLRRNINSKPILIGSNGYLGIPGRNFSAVSLRSGMTAGMVSVTQKKFVFDFRLAGGYGKYVKVFTPQSQRAPGHLDVQVWASMGYCF